MQRSCFRLLRRHYLFNRLTDNYRHAGGAHSRLNGRRFGLRRGAANQRLDPIKQKRVQNENAE